MWLKEFGKENSEMRDLDDPKPQKKKGYDIRFFCTPEE